MSVDTRPRDGLLVNTVVVIKREQTKQVLNHQSCESRTRTHSKSPNLLVEALVHYRDTYRGKYRDITMFFDSFSRCPIRNKNIQARKKKKKK